VNDPGHDRQFREAAQAGYLVKHADGTPYLFQNRGFASGMVDLSNPQACAWVKAIIKDELIARGGASGWMADFGEALPFDAALFGGADPAVWHNRYAVRWSEINREAITEVGRDDLVFFNRSAFTRTPASSTLLWLSDQLQTWDEFDGLKTAVTGLLSGGVSGFSLLHSDVGGYNAMVLKVGDDRVPIPVMGRSKELLMRWAELNAFTCVLRTHEGNNPFISAQFDQDAETLAHFARVAKIYRALGFYRKALVDEAARTGHPVVRHPFLEFPDDPNTYDLKYQFMFGAELMVAPVLDPGLASVGLYLPAGAWVNVWTGRLTEVHAGQWVKSPAPLGRPAVFYRRGSAVGERLVAEFRAAGLD
jgi:alpha-glucosidase